MTAPLCGFTGSRTLSRSWAPLVGRTVTRVIATGFHVATGCALGADSFVLTAAATLDTAPLVFSVASGQFGRGRTAPARRSTALVRAVASSGHRAALVGFTTTPCPSGIKPARSWRSGKPPSGTWSTLALAAGLEIHTQVFWCPADPANLVPMLPDWPGGTWAPVPAGIFAGSWEWIPLEQPPLPTITKSVARRLALQRGEPIS